MGVAANKEMSHSYSYGDLHYRMTNEFICKLYIWEDDCLRMERMITVQEKIKREGAACDEGW